RLCARSLHDALPISTARRRRKATAGWTRQLLDTRALARVGFGFRSRACLSPRGSARRGRWCRDVARTSAARRQGGCAVPEDHHGACRADRVRFERSPMSTRTLTPTRPRTRPRSKALVSTLVAVLAVGGYFLLDVLDPDDSAGSAGSSELGEADLSALTIAPEDTGAHYD